MEGNINVELDELAKLGILSNSKYKITEKIVEAYAKKPEFAEMVNSIEINKDYLRKQVMDKMVDQIISNWLDERNGY